MPLEPSAPLVELEVIDVVRQTKGAVILVLANSPDRPVTFRPGQRLVLVMDLQGSRTERSYHICSDPNVPSRIAIAVERSQGDRLSNFINDYTVRGDRLRFSGPCGEFGLEAIPGARRQLVMVASGAGIHPLLCILMGILAQEPDTRVQLVYHNELLSRTLFRDELVELERRHPNLTVTLVLGRPSTRWKGPSGELEGAVLEQTVPLEPENLYLVCGPRPMTISVVGYLEKAGMPETNIRIEPIPA